MALADNVSMFPGISPLDYDPKIILEVSARQDLTEVVVIGWHENGDMYFTSSMADGPECLWLIEKAKLALLNVGDE